MTDPTGTSDDRAVAREQLVLRIKVGNDLDLSAKSLGITSEELDEWLEDDVFRAEVEKAGAQCEANLVGMVYQAAAAGSVTAAQWLLERGFRGRWAKPTAAMRNDLAAAADDPGDPFAALDNVTQIGSRRKS